MIEVYQYFPTFYEGFTPARSTVKTKDELLTIPFVAHFAKDKSFHRFSLCDEKLMAEYDGGKKWYVVAFVKSSSPIDLPKCEFNKQQGEAK